jgi:carbonic anhydrase/acetyltransferase-like protein (isoleucine patch superfamily)
MKYSLTKNKKEYCGVTLFQIKAEMSFGNVEKGELGGWIEKEENLSKDGNAWVSDNASVYGNAWVYGNAEVYGNASVYDNAKVYGYAKVYDNARVYGYAKVSGDAWVYDNARVSGNAMVSGNAEFSGKIKIISGYFFGMRYDKEEIKYKENEGQELIYKGESKFEEVDDEVEKAIKLLTEKGKLVDGKILNH